SCTQYCCERISSSRSDRQLAASPRWYSAAAWRGVVLVVHCGESRAQRIVGVKPCAASRLARHNRVERTIHDSPRPIRGWGHQNPKCQPEAHAHQLPSGLIVSAISAHAGITVANRAPRTANMIPMAFIEFIVGTPSLQEVVRKHALP